MENDRRDSLDDLLDAALASYAGEPRAGIEARVLSRVRAAGRRTRRTLSSWAALLAAGCLTAGIVVWRRHAPAPERVKVVEIKKNPSVVVARNAEPQKPMRKLRKHVEFPDRAPLTREERGLVAFVRSEPEEAQRMLGDMRPIEIEPLRVEKIEIEPLPEEESPDQSGN